MVGKNGNYVDNSQGYCLLNNVAIAAAYALCVYRHRIHRVAIVDFDVHHGNGTEAIVKQLGQEVSEISPRPPMTWVDPETDRDRVFFASVHAFNPDGVPGEDAVYPGSGETGTIGNIINVGLAPSQRRSIIFRNQVESEILPALTEFKPDLILVSAGFDGHARDDIELALWTTEDFVWATEKMVALANKCCDGWIVSVLEGGYNTKGGPLSPLAESVAAHVRTLNYAPRASNPPPHRDTRGATLDEHHEVVAAAASDDALPRLVPDPAPLVRRFPSKKPGGAMVTLRWDKAHHQLEVNGVPAVFREWRSFIEITRARDPAVLRMIRGDAAGDEDDDLAGDAPPEWWETTMKTAFRLTRVEDKSEELPKGIEEEVGLGVGSVFEWPTLEEELKRSLARLARRRRGR